jgi:cytochrome b561
LAGIAALLAAGAFMSGCLVLRLSPPQQIWPPPPPPAQDPASLGLHLSLVLLTLLLLLAGFWARRAWRRAGEGLPLDREDQALLRTARDALVYLIKRRLKRVRLVAGGKR